MPSISSHCSIYQFATTCVLGICLLAASGCVSNPTAESGVTNILSSTDLVQNNEFPFPFILVSFEKTSGQKRYEAAGFNPNADFYKNRAEKQGIKEIKLRLEDPKRMYLSLITRFPDSNPAENNNAKFIYKTSLEGDLIQKTLDGLTVDLALAVKTAVAEAGATHILLFCTGWNTDQTESIKNYREWANSLALANTHSERKIRPIMIGISWPSYWEKWGSLISFENKANDADELGMFWSNLIINKTLAKIKDSALVKLVVVGHSFGARSTSMALYSAPLIEPSGELPARPHVDLFIGLQAAFSDNRFIAGKGKEGSPYSFTPRPSNKFIFTSSKYDLAVQNNFFSDFISSMKARDEMDQPPYNGTYENRIMKADGKWNEAPSSDPSLVTIINSDLVINESKSKRSGAHSDVYKRQIGEFLLQSILEFAPPK